MSVSAWKTASRLRPAWLMTCGRRLPEASIGVRAMGFALASSESRSLGVQVVGVQAGREPGTSTLPGLLTAGRYLQDPNAAEMVIGAVLARNLKVQIGEEITLLGSGRDGSFAAGIVSVVGILRHRYGRS